MINDESAVIIKSLEDSKRDKYNFSNGIDGKKSNKSNKSGKWNNSNQNDNSNVLSHENLIGVSGLIAEPPYLHLLFGISYNIIDNNSKHSIYGNLRYVVKNMNNEITLIDKLNWLLDIAFAV